MTFLPICPYVDITVLSNSFALGGSDKVYRRMHCLGGGGTLSYALSATSVQMQGRPTDN